MNQKLGSSLYFDQLRLGGPLSEPLPWLMFIGALILPQTCDIHRKEGRWLGGACEHGSQTQHMHVAPWEERGPL